MPGWSRVGRETVLKKEVAIPHAGKAEYPQKMGTKQQIVENSPALTAQVAFCIAKRGEI
jgi:hypothetical protein